MSTVTHFPKSRPSKLAGHFGGLSREKAVEAATRELQVMRPESDKAILSAVAQMEKIVTAATRRGGAALMRELLPLCDQIVTLAGTFGYGVLDKAARSLCDLLDSLLGGHKNDLASIRVHVEIIRMFTPGTVPPGREQTEVMLLELAKLLNHRDLAAKVHGGAGEDDSVAVAR
jgi:hypothetical protein